MDKSNIYTIRFQFLSSGRVPLHDEETRRVIMQYYINLFQKQKVQKDSKNYAYNGEVTRKTAFRNFIVIER